MQATRSTTLMAVQVVAEMVQSQPNVSYDDVVRTVAKRADLFLDEARLVLAANDIQPSPTGGVSKA